MTTLLHRTLSKPPLGIRQRFFWVLAQKKKEGINFFILFYLIFFYQHTNIPVSYFEKAVTPAHRKEYSALTPVHTQLCPHAGDCNLKQSVQTHLSALPWGTDVQLLCHGPSLQLLPDFWIKKFIFNILFLELFEPRDHERARPGGNEEGTLQSPLEYFECRPAWDGGTTVIPNFTSK